MKSKLSSNSLIGAGYLGPVISPGLCRDTRPSCGQHSLMCFPANTHTVTRSRETALYERMPPSRRPRCTLVSHTMRFLIGLIALVTVRRERRTNNENGIATTLLEGDARQLAMLIAVVLLTVMTAVAIRSRLGRQYGAELAERSRTAAVSRTA